MPDLKLTVKISEDEATKLKSWQLQGLIESDDEIFDSLMLIRNQEKNKEKPVQAGGKFWLGTNRKQRIVILLGTAIIATMLLFPPYKSYRQRGEGGEPAGYGLFFDPTLRLKASLDYLSIKIVSGSNVYVDTSTLFVQILLIAVLTTVACAIFKSP